MEGHPEVKESTVEFDDTSLCWATGLVQYTIEDPIWKTTPETVCIAFAIIDKCEKQ